MRKKDDEFILDSVTFWGGPCDHQGIIFQQTLGSGSLKLKRGLNWRFGNVKVS